MLHSVGHAAVPDFARTPDRSITTSSTTVHRPRDAHAPGLSNRGIPGGPNPQPAEAAKRSPTARNDDASSGKQGDLTEDERRQVAELAARDREVRAHEMAHKAAAGQYGGPVSFDYQAGPDGKRYAVGGEVSIDSSPIRDNPEATIRKMQVIARAALAPAQPSAQDRTVATKAQQAAAQARQELMADRLRGEEPGNQKVEEYEPAPELGQEIDKRA